MFRGTGYNYPDSSTVYELMHHRRRQLAALSVKARRDDERAELERELNQLDEDIARGVAELDRMQGEARARMAQSLRERIERKHKRRHR